MRVYAQTRRKRVEEGERGKGGGDGETAEVAAITLCSLGYANGLIRNNNKKRSNELGPPHPRLV